MYKISDTDKTTIIELIKVCNKVNLDNLNYSYLENFDNVEIYMDKRHKCIWDLTIVIKQKRYIYTYEEQNNNFIYSHTEA